MYSGAFLELLGSEDEGRTLFRKLSNYLPLDMV